MLQPRGRLSGALRLSKLRFPGHKRALGSGTRHPVTCCLQPAWPGVGRTEERLAGGGDSLSPSLLHRRPKQGPTPSPALILHSGCRAHGSPCVWTLSALSPAAWEAVLWEGLDQRGSDQGPMLAVAIEVGTRQCVISSLTSGLSPGMRDPRGRRGWAPRAGSPRSSQGLGQGQATGKGVRR